MTVKVEFLTNGFEFVSPTPQLAVHKLRSLDWLRYESIWEYKAEVEKRCSVQGISFTCWDATSFLMGLQTAGICSITLNYSIDESKGAVK